MKSLFEGVGVALVTPFIENMIDYESLVKIIDRDINAAINIAHKAICRSH